MGLNLGLLFPQLIVELRYTRDFPAPIASDDWEMETGWRSVPVPPSDDPAWKIFDTRKDRRTGWQRIRVAWAEVDIAQQRGGA
jgi:hypothetical protein